MDERIPSYDIFSLFVNSFLTNRDEIKITTLHKMPYQCLCPDVSPDVVM